MAPDSGGMSDRTCTLTGSREAINRAKDLIMSIVQQRSRTEGLGGPPSGGGGPGGNPGGPGGMGGLSGLNESLNNGPSHVSFQRQ